MQSPQYRKFWVKVYKTSKEFYQTGQMQLVNCHHVWEGDYWMNAYGELVATVGSNFPGELSPPEAGSPPVPVPAALETQGNVFNTQAFAQNMVQVTKIKDMYLLDEFIIDKALYYQNVVTCNPPQHN